LASLFRDRFFLALEQLLRGVAPRAEVVFIEDHEVPIDRVEPLVFGLDVSRRVAAQQILEGAEIDDRLLGIDSGRVALGVAREVLPAVEVHVILKVRLPRILHRRLKGHHEHALGSKLPGKLVGGEGLAKTHQSWTLELSSDPDPTTGYTAWLPSRDAPNPIELNYRLTADR